MRLRLGQARDITARFSQRCTPYRRLITQWLSATGVLLVLIGMSGPAAPAQTVVPLQRLALVDHNGKSLGSVVAPQDPDDAAQLILQVAGVLFELDIYPPGWDEPGDNKDTQPMFYETSDCTGAAYVFVAPGGLYFGSVRGPGHTLWGPTSSAVARSISTRSVAYKDSECFLQEERGEMVPVQPLVNLDEEFVPPYRYVPVSGSTSAAACCADCNGDRQVTVDELLKGVDKALNGCPAN